MQSTSRRPLDADHVHFVGIGGAGMGALAELFIAMGYRVSGSDLKDSRTVRRLSGLGATVKVGQHRAGNAGTATHVVVSAAVPSDNPEVKAAQDAGATIISRAELLARISDAGTGLAVSGTHGKTTTSSMLARVLSEAGRDPTFIIGGDLNDVGSGARLGSSDIVVVEADEAFGSFLHLHAAIAIVTNVETDHLDFYKTPEAIDEAFVTFLSNRDAGGPAIVCADDPGAMRVASRVDGPIITYGKASDSDMHIGTDKSLRYRGKPLGTMRLSVPGDHNVLNASAALVAAILCDVPASDALKSLERFSGVERRFTLRGQVNGVSVVDDYAHHPREIAATLAAARERFGSGRIIALFQPHLYSRTRDLTDGFGTAFDDADVAIITDIYGAREEPIAGVSGRLILDAIHRLSSGSVVATYAPLLTEAAGLAAGMAEAGGVILTIGAGDVTSAGPRILELLEAMR